MSGVVYACFKGQHRMTGYYLLATEAQMFCRKGWHVAAVKADEIPERWISRSIRSEIQNRMDAQK